MRISLSKSIFVLGLLCNITMVVCADLATESSNPENVIGTEAPLPLPNTNPLPAIENSLVPEVMESNQPSVAITNESEIGSMEQNLNIGLDASTRAQITQQL